MKNIIFGLLFTTFLSFAYAQESKKIAEFPNATTLAVFKETGKYEFTLPQSTTVEKVSKTSGFYTDYFVVNYNPSNQQAVVTMKENTSINRYILLRFLLSNEIYDVKIDGTEIPAYDFAEQYLK